MWYSIVTRVTKSTLLSRITRILFPCNSCHLGVREFLEERPILRAGGAPAVEPVPRPEVPPALRPPLQVEGRPVVLVHLRARGNRPRRRQHQPRPDEVASDAAVARVVEVGGPGVDGLQGPDSIEKC